MYTGPHRVDVHQKPIYFKKKKSSRVTYTLGRLDFLKTICDFISRKCFEIYLT